MAGERAGRAGRTAPPAEAPVATPVTDAAPSAPGEAPADVAPFVETPPADADAPGGSDATADTPPAPGPDGAPDGPDAPVAADTAEPAPTVPAAAPMAVAEPLTIVTVAESAPVAIPLATRLYDDLLAEAERATAAGRGEVAAALHVADLRLREFVACLGRAIDAVEHPDLGRRLTALWHLIH